MHIKEKIASSFNLWEIYWERYVLMQCQDCVLQSTELSKTSNFWKPGHMLSILALSPLSNAPTCPMSTSCLCTIAKLLGHDHRRQREESCVLMGGTHTCPVLKHWTCFPETVSNLLHFITHLCLWKKKKKSHNIKTTIKMSKAILSVKCL